MKNKKGDRSLGSTFDFHKENVRHCSRNSLPCNRALTTTSNKPLFIMSCRSFKYKTGGIDKNNFAESKGVIKNVTCNN